MPPDDQLARLLLGPCSMASEVFRGSALRDEFGEALVRMGEIVYHREKSVIQQCRSHGQAENAVRQTRCAM
jgi:hypothetical protein